MIVSKAVGMGYNILACTASVAAEFACIGGDSERSVGDFTRMGSPVGSLLLRLG